MPASLKRIRDTRGTVLLHVCETCGAGAPFGVGVDLRSATKAMSSRDMAAAKRHLGEWYCREHRPDAGQSEQRAKK